MKKAFIFGHSIEKKADRIIADNGNLEEINVPGHYPYKEASVRRQTSPLTEEVVCLGCETCIKVYPVEALHKSVDTIETDKRKSTMCCACVKYCPANAREVKDNEVLSFAKKTK